MTFAKKLLIALSGITMSITGILFFTQNNNKNEVSVEAASNTYSFSNIPTSGWNKNGGTVTINGIEWTYTSNSNGISGSSSGIALANSGSLSWSISTDISNFGTNATINSVEVKSNKTSGTGGNTTATATITVGSETESDKIFTVTNSVTLSDIEVSSGKIKVDITAQKKVSKVTLTDIIVSYSTGPSAPDLPEYKSMFITGDLQKKTYYVGDEWDLKGLEIKGINMKDKSEDICTLNSETYKDYISYTLTPAKPELGTTKLTISNISFTTKSQTYSINNVSKTGITVKSSAKVDYINLVGDMTTKKYEEDDDWSFDGLYFLATLTDGTTANIGTFDELYNNNKLIYEVDPSNPVVGTTSISFYDMAIEYDDEVYDVANRTVNGIVVSNPNSEAFAFAEYFLSKITCDNGVTAPSKTNWSLCVSEYGKLSTGAMAILTDATYSVTGSSTNTIVTATNGTNQTIAEAVAKYDYIVSKYGASNYSNFMKREFTSSNTTKLINKNDSSMVLVVFISCLTTLSFGCAAFFKKRKAIAK